MLDELFKPSSVAVIGASGNPDKLGYAVMNNLIHGGYSKYGKIFPINLAGEKILGVQSFRSIKEIPDPIDLAIIVIPYHFVPNALIECGEQGVKAAVIITAGFRESGMDGLERELQLIEIAKKFRIRLVGPNCLGVIDTFTPLNASFSAGTPPQGPMAFMSQSGALGTAVLDIAISGRLGLSKFISLGNKSDVNENDILEAWVNDDNTKVILIYSEGMPDGQEFIRVAQQVTRIKPVIAIKSGLSQSGSRAVSSHTGSLAGSEEAYRAAFRQAGIIRADTMESLFDMALAIGYQPPLLGNQIAIITNAGGPGILATDALERYGLSIARFTNLTIQSLEKFLPDAASAANPVDLLGDALADRYHYALDKVINDPNVNGILVLLTPQANTQIELTAEVISKTSEANSKPILACFMGETKVKPGIEILSKFGVPNYPFPERAALAFKAMDDYRKMQEKPIYQIIKYEAQKDVVVEIFQKARQDGRVSIGAAESENILNAYGISIPKSTLAIDADDAVKKSQEIGYPVVLKISSPDILHKTDIGGVKIGLKNPEEVLDAYELMIYRTKRYVPDAQIWGCQVQEMVPSGGIEVLVGMNRDPQFGPLITFGLGGIYVEALKDVSFRIAPFAIEDAYQMLDEIRANALLNGIRGKPMADKAAIVNVIMRISQLALDFPEIAEIDINPLVVYTQGQGAIALDMRVVLTPKFMQE